MNLIERAKNIIVTPNTEWDEVLKEEATMQKVITTYVVPMALLGAAAAFVGYGLIGIKVPFFGTVSGINIGVQHAVISFIGTLLGVIITAFVVDLLAPSFGSEKNIARSTQLVAYAFTPGFIGGLFSVLPSLALIGSLLGLYGIYIMYLGLPKLKKTPEDKVVLYLVITILCLIVAMMIVGILLATITAAILGTHMIGV